jgi:multidrug resistance efflux pump
VTAPLFIGYDGHVYRATDWSLGGFRLDGVTTQLPEPGSQIAVDMTLPFQGFDVSFSARAEVVRTDPARGMLVCQFVEMGERERDVLQHFIEELVRGAMVDVQDTIQRIDVPVTPASLEPTKPRGPQMPVRRWPVKAIVMTALYGVLGVAILGYAALLGYTNFWRLEVQTAVISAPTETVASQADGTIRWTGRKPGDRIQSGETVVAVIDNELEREIELAAIAVSERKTQLDFLRRRLASEQDRMRSYATVETKSVEQVRLEIQSVEAQLRAAEQQYGRLAHLHMKGYATDARLEEAEKPVATLRKSLDSRRVELAGRTKLAGQTQDRFHYTGNVLVGETEQLAAEVERAESDVRLSERKLAALQNQKDRLAVRAPFDGTLLELPRVDRGAVRRGDVIAILEQRKLRQVTAYLNQDEVLRVGQGDEVLIYIPSLRETQKGTVETIDRT